MPVKNYVKEIAERYASGGQTEMSYRTSLENLLRELHPTLEITQEPQANKFGRPDFLIAQSGRVLGYIETKAIGDTDLEGRKLNKAQFDRYKDALHNIIFTDYLHFILYRKGEAVLQARVGELLGGKIKRRHSEEKELHTLLTHFVQFGGIPITRSDQLATIMAGKARLMADVIERVLDDDLRQQEQAEQQGLYFSKGSLLSQLEAFRQSLISDLDANGFADIYAQTIAYGLFAARFNDPTLGSFTRQEAAHLLPKSNPFLRRLFNHIAGPDIDERILWVVEELVDIFRLCDVREIMTDFDQSVWSEDPIIHFYEDFLAEFDKATRKDRGVWYTPQPVVSFMVRAVDQLLQSHFGLQHGLADSSKIEVMRSIDGTRDGRRADGKKQVPITYHRVQILDPATGTGTFLAEIVREMYRKFRGQEGLWQEYVSAHLLPRLHAFELLMASYAMAHFKLDVVLKETGYNLSDGTQKRLGIYLTNTLEEAAQETGSLFSSWLSDEANQANFVKRDTPVMVVIGNPPYSGESANKGKWITQLMEAYKKEPGGKVKLKERNSKWLNDDYVKFIRYAEHLVARNENGILAYINPHGFLDNPTFRGMRWHLLRTFDEIYVLDLHGNARKKEVSPDGSPDQNVFDIMQGVSINFFVKTGKKAPNALGKVYHADLWGSRDEKYSWLENNYFTKELYTEVSPVAPHYFFVPKDTEGREEYLSGFGVNELMKENGVGITSARDKFLIDRSYDTLLNRIERFQSSERSESKLHQEFNIRRKKGWNILISYDGIQQKNVADYIQPISYRPFDNQFVIYEDSMLWRPVRRIFKHFIAGENVGLVVARQCASDWRYVFITETINDINLTGTAGSYGSGYTFPLYLYPDEGGLLASEGRRPNLDEGIVAKIAEGIGLRFVPEVTGEEGTFAPIDLLDYIYGVLHHPEYRERYFEFLKVDFPRIPYPSSAEQLWSYGAIGKELRQLHLMESPQLNQLLTKYPIEGDNFVEKEGRDKSGRVWINETQYFADVPEVAWECYIGGYQPAQKWLKDRRGSHLTYDELLHYQRIIVALTETTKLMEQLAQLPLP